jgi:hypothetical protein
MSGISSATTARTSQPEDQQQVAQDAAGQRRLDHFGKPALQRQHHDDQLSGVAERGIQEPTQPGAEVLGSLFSSRPNQPGQRQHRQRRGHENQHVVGADEAQDECDGQEDRQQVQAMCGDVLPERLRVLSCRRHGRSHLGSLYR